MDIITAAEINNEAQDLEAKGCYHAAEKKFLQALKIKEESSFSNPVDIALSQNLLAALYMKIERLDKAQELLEKAYEARKGKNNFDKSATAENLGRLFEMRGDSDRAIEWRTANEPNRMMCSFINCPKTEAVVFSKLDQLKICGRCKCAYYCGKECQTNDWARHKKYCRLCANNAAKKEAEEAEKAETN